MPSAYSQKSRHIASPYPQDSFVASQTSRDYSIMEKEEMTPARRIGIKSRVVKKYLTQELSTPWTGTFLIICFFTSGLIDSVAFNSWSCFVGMQTGNTIFAALGLSGQPQSTHRQQYYKSLVSIGSFCLGTLFFNLLHRRPHYALPPTRKQRYVFVLSFVVQTLLILAAAALINIGVVSNRPAVSGSFSSGSYRTATVSTATNFVDLAPIAILAFEAAGQVSLSRVLETVELPTIVLSTLYHDFTADLYGMAEAWRKSDSISSFLFESQRRQGKRLGSMVALFLGGIVGGEMFKSAAGMSGSLFFAAGLKGAISIAWLFWKGSDQVDDEAQELPT